LKVAIGNGETVAFAREGRWRPMETGQPPDDVLTVEFCDESMDRPAIILQRFRRQTLNAQFQLLGEPALVVDGSVVDHANARDALDDLLLGVRSHAAVRDLWDSWQHRRNERRDT
jgi:hypothetical protein